MNALFGRAEFVKLSLSLVVGSAALLISWLEVSGTAQQADQWPWLNLGLAGLIVSGLGIAVWLVGATRRVTRARQTLLAGLATPPSVAPLDAVTLVTAPRMTRYHRPDCVLMVGKPAEATTADLQPCGLCQADAS